MSPFGAALLLSLAALAACRGSQEERDPLAIRPLTKAWERAIPLQPVPDGLETLRASECGECHEEIYEEWRGSTHAQALADLQFQAEWEKDGFLFVCRNCHTPLQNQQETVVTGLIGGDYHRPAEAPNAEFDAMLKDEAITCAVCHVRDGVIIGPHGDAADAPHPVRHDTQLLSAQACLGCHNVQGVLSATLMCTFATGDEWEASPYPGQGEDCVTCHMPEVRRSNAEGEQVRASNQHVWFGGGIAKFPGQEDLALRGYVSGLEVQVSSPVEAAAPGDTAHLAVTVRNARAGHELPTGDVERFVTVNMALLGPNDELLQERQERIGELWEWWPAAKQLADNSLKPLEERRYEMRYDVPAVPDQMRLRVVVTNHRMTEANAQAMGVLGSYPLAAKVLEKEYPLTIQSGGTSP